MAKIEVKKFQPTAMAAQFLDGLAGNPASASPRRSLVSADPRAPCGVPV